MVDSSEVRQISALLRYYFHLNPDELNEVEFYERWAELEWVLKKTGQYGK